MGEMKREMCAIWQESDGGSAKPATVSASNFLLPWSGNSLGLADLSFIAGRSCPKVIGIIGPESAGKTTLLAAWYLLLGRGSTLTGNRFAGSFTLSGWENIAQSLRWTSGGGPTFPAHTSSGSQRTPGLLHLSIRRQPSNLLLDFLLADAPGEWFRSWAINKNAADAVGGCWVSQHSDVFLVMADSEALAGHERGLLEIFCDKSCSGLATSATDAQSRSSGQKRT
jgi:hypothetical protein